MKPIHYVLIAIGALLLIGLCIFLFMYLKAKSNKKKADNSALEYCNELIKLVGGIDNIVEVSSISSRLTLTLKDNNVITEDVLNSFKEKKIGIFRTSKKITLVIGDLANTYKEKIENLKTSI